MSNRYEEGDQVKWKWGNGYGHGSEKSCFTQKVIRKIDGSEITRDGSKDNPADYIETDDGGNVLKLGSELESA